MKEERDFDEIMRDKFSSENNFPFSDDKWARMEELIIADQNRKKKRKFWMIFFSGFLTAIFIVAPIIWYFYGTKTKLQTAGNKQQSEPLHPGDSKKSNPGNNNSGGKPNQHKTPVNPESTSEKNPGEGNPSISNPTVSENTPTQNKSAAHGSAQGEQSDSAKKEVKRSIKPTVQTKKGNQDQVNETRQNGNEVAQDSGKGTKNNAGETEITKKQEIDEPLVKVEEKKESVQPEIIEESKKDSISEVKKTEEQELAKQDSAKAEVVVEKIDKPDPVILRKWGWNLFAGANYNLGYQENKNSPDGRSFAPIAGFGLVYHLPSDWAISSGVYYTCVSNLSYKKEIVQRSYDFGYRDQVYTLSQQKNHYLTVPLEINKSIKQKNTFSLGVQMAYLCSSSASYSVFQRNSLSETPAESKTVKGYYDGLNRMDFQLGLAYERLLFANFSAKIQFVYGLNDVRQNSWTLTDTQEHNKALRLVLVYKLR